MHGGEEAGRKAVENLVSIFGPNNVYVELQRHQEREQEWRNQPAIRIAHSLKLSLLATNGVRYASADDREILDLFTTIRNHTELDKAGRLLTGNKQRHLRSAHEMTAWFRDVPGAVANTAELSSRLTIRSLDMNSALGPGRPGPATSFGKHQGPAPDRNQLNGPPSSWERVIRAVADLGGGWTVRGVDRGCIRLNLV